MATLFSKTPNAEICMHAQPDILHSDELSDHYHPGALNKMQRICDSLSKVIIITL